MTVQLKLPELGEHVESADLIKIMVEWRLIKSDRNHLVVPPNQVLSPKGAGQESPGREPWDHEHPGDQP